MNFIISLMEVKILNKLNSFFSKFPAHAYKKRELLIRAYADPIGVYYLKAGRVRQYSIHNNGRETTLNIYKPHSFFPMSSVLNPVPNKYFFEAIDNITVFIAPKNEILSFIKNEPEIMLDLLKRLYRGMDGILTRLEFLMSGTTRQKLITVLLISANRFGVTDKGNMSLNIKFTHQDLAYLSGLSRETVSREMMSLKQQNLINYSGSSFTFFDIKNLENELSF